MDIVLQHLARPRPAHTVVTRCPVVAGEGGVVILLLRPLLPVLRLLLLLVLLLLLLVMLLMMLLLLLVVGCTRVHRHHGMQAVIVVARGHVGPRPRLLPGPAPSPVCLSHRH